MFCYVVSVLFYSVCISGACGLWVSCVSCVSCVGCDAYAVCFLCCAQLCSAALFSVPRRRAMSCSVTSTSRLPPPHIRGDNLASTHMGSRRRTGRGRRSADKAVGFTTGDNASTSGRRHGFGRGCGRCSWMTPWDVDRRKCAAVARGWQGQRDRR